MNLNAFYQNVASWVGVKGYSFNIISVSGGGLRRCNVHWAITDSHKVQYVILSLVQ